MAAEVLRLRIVASTHITRKSGHVTLALLIDGKPRRFVMEPDDALLISQRLGNEAADSLPSTDGLPVVENLLLRPFHGEGRALLQFTLSNLGGPVTLAIDDNWLRALSQAAEAALEFSEPAGQA